MKKKMMILGIAAILSLSVLGGCGKEDTEPDTNPVSTEGSAQAEEGTVEKPSLDDPEQVKMLEEDLADRFDSVEQVEVVHEGSEYHIRLTLTSSEESINEELQDLIISKMVQNYADLTEDQIIIEQLDWDNDEFLQEQE